MHHDKRWEPLSKALRCTTDASALTATSHVLLFVSLFFSLRWGSLESGFDRSPQPFHPLLESPLPWLSSLPLTLLPLSLPLPLPLSLPLPLPDSSRKRFTASGP